MLPSTSRAALVALIFIHCLIMFLTSLKGLTENNVKPFGPVALLGLGLLLTLPFGFMQTSFGTKDFGSLLLTLKENQVERLVAVGIEGFLPQLVSYVLACAFLLVCAWMLSRYFLLGRSTVYAFSTFLLFFNPVTHHIFRVIYPNPAHEKIDVNNVVRNFEIINYPKRKRNLVVLYLESLERTYRYLPETKSEFVPFSSLEDRGLSFRNILQAKSAFSTIGGLVASQCGVPLLPRGAFNPQKRQISASDQHNKTVFMQGVDCLGDILAEDGYTLSYINGSDLSVFSKGDFFRSHGYQRVKGLKSWPDWENEPRLNVWGMDDDLLFERVTSELRDLASENSPFVLSALTIATHGPDAYPDKSCPVVGTSSSQLPRAISCTAHHVESLINEVVRLGIAEDTLIVLLSDHLAFRNTLENSLQDRRDRRRNFAVVLGLSNETNSRPGTMFDVFPTLLELLGYQLKDGRAGLGQSLVNENPTFVERESLDTLNAAIKYNSELQKALWEIGTTSD